MNSNDNGQLRLDLVHDPQMWRMCLRLSPERVEAAVYCPTSASSLIYRSFPLAWASETALAALIYQHPLLTADFGRVRLVVETPRLMAVPSCVDSDDDRLMLMRTAYPQADFRVLSQPLELEGAQMLMGLDAPTASLLARTYPDATAVSHLSVLCSHLGQDTAFGNGSRMLAQFRRGAVDVVACRNRRLLLANTFRFSQMDDAMYYLVASRQSLGLPPTDTLLVAGAPALRPPVDRLRRLLPGAMPMLPQPRMLALGREAPSVPLEMLL